MTGMAALGIAYVLSQFYRVFLAVLSPTLSAELGVGAAALGWASAAWFIAFALMQIPLGLALDRIGPRRTAGWLITLAGGAGAGLFAGAQGAAGLIAGMALIGVACAPVLMASFFIFARSFDARRFAMLASAMLGVGALGNIAAAAPMSAAAEALGWRAALMVLGAVTVAVGLAVLLWLRDPPAPAEGGAQDGGLRDYLALLATPHLWPLYLMMFVNYAPVVGIRGLWAGPYLAQVFALDAGAIGLATLWMALAMAAGSFALGPLDQILRTRKWIVAGATLTLSACCAALALWPDAGAALSVALLAAIGFAGMSFGVMMAHARPFFPPAMTGRGVTLMNFFCMAGVGTMQAVTGGLLAGAADPVAGFSAVFGFYALATAAVSALYVFSRDSRP